MGTHLLAHLEFAQRGLRALRSHGALVESELVCIAAVKPELVLLWEQLLRPPRDGHFGLNTQVPDQTDIWADKRRCMKAVWCAQKSNLVRTRHAQLSRRLFE